MSEAKSVKEDINKLFKGKVVVQLGSEVEDPYKNRIPSGSFSLDCGIGGGLPQGGLSQYVGMDSSGKTTMALKTIAETQKKFGEGAKIALASVEHPLDKRWAEKVGVQMDDTISLVKTATGEMYLEALKEYINSNEFNLIVIDSISALANISKTILSSNLGDKNVATGASLITDFISQAIYGAESTNEGKSNRTAVLVTNQYRAKIGGASFMGTPRKQFGGYSLTYAKLLDIDFNKGEEISEGEKEKKEVYGNNIRFRVLKAKAGACDGATGSFDLYKRNYGNFSAGDIDTAKEYRIQAIKHGIIERAGSYFKFQGKNHRLADLEKWIRDDEEIKTAIKNEIFSNLGYELDE